MLETLPIKKYIKVWIKKRKNNVKADGNRSISYTLEWVEFGQRRFLSLGKHATAAFAGRLKEKELNSLQQSQGLEPITWDAFREKYLTTIYPGYDLPAVERREASTSWEKSPKTMKREKLAMENFERIVKPYWCHEITDEDRQSFIQTRIKEVGAAISVDAELRSLRLFCNVMEDWKHRPEHSNPFAGRGKATVGERRKRNKDREKETKPGYYTLPELRALLSLADKEAKAEPTWQKLRLGALVYFMAYTGARINEALHVEWKDIDWEKGIAWLFFKIEHDLKTAGSQAPFGLPDALLSVLRDWEKHRTCSWVFPNSQGKPWASGGPGYRPFDQLQALAKRAGIAHANWKMFRHSFDTHGKGKFGMTREQGVQPSSRCPARLYSISTHAWVASLRKASVNSG